MLKVAVFLAVSFTVASSVVSRADTSTVCDEAAIKAASEELIPRNVLLAVTRIETGRTRNGQIHPWPWTANVAGSGHFFDDANALQVFLERQLKGGQRNFDTGCFQINYRWHGQEFSSLQQMIDPLENARYAARFLRKLYQETGDWTSAVGAYHSRTKRHADRYKLKFAQLSNTLNSDHETDHHPLQENDFALLRPGANPKLTGSLVPLAGGQTASILDR